MGGSYIDGGEAVERGWGRIGGWGRVKTEESSHDAAPLWLGTDY